MEEAPENGKESPHSVHANGLIDNIADYFGHFRETTYKPSSKNLRR